MPDVKVRVIELTDHILHSYDRKIGEFVAKQFSRSGTELVLNSRVVKVEDGSITVAGPDGQETAIPFGTCVWATGIAKSPLVQQLQELFPQQQMHSR
jgi:NADH:ubiquinone reductase (non-electrogenic)